MLPQSTATLANSPWNPLIGLLLAAGGIFLIGIALTVTVSQVTLPAPSLTEREGRAVVAGSARTAWLTMRTWPRSRFGTISTRAEAGFDGYPHQRPMSDIAMSVRVRDPQKESDQLAAILQRAHLRNPLVVVEDEPRGEHVNRKCPTCDVRSGRSDASVD